MMISMVRSVLSSFSLGIKISNVTSLSDLEQCVQRFPAEDEFEHLEVESVTAVDGHSSVV